MRNRLVRLNGRRCECGALAEDSAATCRKCRNRARWLRRKKRRLPRPVMRTWHPAQERR